MGREKPARDRRPVRRRGEVAADPRAADGRPAVQPREDVADPAEAARAAPAEADTRGVPAEADAALLELAARLHSAALHLLRRVRREDPAMGLPPARASALSVLVFAGPRSLGELAAVEQVRPPTMSRIVAGLEAAGLVTREPDPHDRRSARLVASARGREILEAGRDRRVHQLEALLAGLEPRERALLEQAAGVMERLAGQG